MQICEADHAANLGERIDALSGANLRGEKKNANVKLPNSFFRAAY